MIAGTLIGATIFLLLYFFVSHETYWTKQGVTQMPIKLLISEFIQLLLRRRCMPDFCVFVYNAFPGTRYIGVNQIRKPALLIRDPDLIKDLTIKSFDHFADHQFQPSERFEPVWAKNLFMLKGKKWRTARPILSASFTSTKMKIMFGLISDCAQNFCDHFLKKEGQTIEVELKDIYTRFTNDIIATTAFGIELNSLKDRKNEFYMLAQKVFNFTNGFFKILKLIILLELPTLYEFLGVPVFDTNINYFFTKIIDDTIKLREEKGIVRPDMLQLLMEAKKQTQTKTEDSGTDDAHGKENKISMELTNLDIASHAFFFFAAGNDSVAITLSFLSYELALNSEIQNMLRDEIEKTFEECNGKITYDALMKMKYMDMVLSEVLRKWPPLFAMDRQCTKPYTIEPQFAHEVPVYLKKGSIFWLPIFGLHRDPKYYPDPERFDPERFNDERKRNIRIGTYIPFGLGPRQCIASRFSFMEIKTLMFYILHHFEIVATEKSQIPLKLKPTTTNLESDGGFWFGFKKLNNSIIHERK